MIIVIPSMGVRHDLFLLQGDGFCVLGEMLMLAILA
jgi:uncharacterized membrane protein YkgB